ncbi:hypothetical protein [Streptomyces sporangiiformans]|uniref:Uncharacterized protein n=1 Tax=Streptomyces sporangiiformans TaxID=2315329 RepID=A0A505DCK0_9ACTN|nr:hypothetical protein [Streptomyces sporangiiformans]TPQ20222.1 hypothetical protein FGD71_021380 [Streptomyces sporangiiformans]
MPRQRDDEPSIAGPEPDWQTRHDAGPSSWDDEPSSWQEDDQPEHTHDPHEVTVQLDNVGPHLEEWLVQQAKGAPRGKSASEGADGPVFVDETGRRSRRFRRIGMAVGVACAVYAVVILATLLSGNSSAPWLPVQGQKDEKPAQKVDSPPLPADSAKPSGSTSPSPGQSPSDNPTATLSPGAGTAPNPSASASKSGKPTDPKPSATSTKPAPDNPPASPDPSDDPPASPDPDPDPTETGGATDDPTDPPVAGSDNVADSPLTPEPTFITLSPTVSSSPESIL